MAANPGKLKEIKCDVSLFGATFDLEIDGTVYRGAGLHGSGGRIGAGNHAGPFDDPEHYRKRAESELRVRARRERLALVYTVDTAPVYEHLRVPPRSIKVLAAYPPDPATRVEGGAA